MQIEDIIKKNKAKRMNYVTNNQPLKKENPASFLKFKNLISRILITIILVLGSIIYINSSSQNKELYRKYVLENSLSFTKINNWYQNLFGRVDIQTPSNSTPVFKAINYQNIEPYKNGSKLTVSNNEIINVITSGIVVYIGDKDDLGNTVIIQGNDGVDIWYSNITDTDIKVYDYVESGNILGTANTDYIYLTILQDGKYLSYEEYQKLI